MDDNHPRVGDEEADRQLALLDGLRHDQSRELIERGIASRVIGSLAVFNASYPLEPITDNAEFFPFRRRTDKVSGFVLQDLVRERGLLPTGMNRREFFRAFSALTGSSLSPTYLLFVGRIDNLENGGYRHTPYMTGVDLSNNSTESASGLWPVEGVTKTT